MKIVRIRIYILFLIGFVLIMAACSKQPSSKVKTNEAVISASALPLAPNISEPEYVGWVSINQLITDPEKYDKKRILVTGFVSFEFEDNALYQHRDDFQYGILKNAIWVDFDPETEKLKDKYDQKYVTINGTFNAKDQGHMGMYSGTINQLQRIDLRRHRPIKEN